MTEAAYSLEYCDEPEGESPSDQNLGAPELSVVSTEDEITQLLELCRQYGRITAEELAIAADELKLSEDQVIELYERLDEMEVEIVHTEGDNKDKSGSKDQSPDLKIEESAAMSTDSFRLFLDKAGKHRILSAAEEIELAKRHEQGDMSARDEFLTNNIKLVVSIAKRYKGQGLELDDLTNEGILGLFRAVDKFDWRKGYKFSTYATWWIKQAVKRSIHNDANVIRHPVHVGEIKDAIYKSQAELWQRLKREPTIQEIAEETGLPHEKVADAMDVLKNKTNLISFDKPIGEEEETSLGELIASDNQYYDPVERTEESTKSAALWQALYSLPEQEKEALVLRFGLLNETPMTFEEIGREMHINKDNASRLVKDALGRLQVKDYLLESIRNPERGSRNPTPPSNQNGAHRPVNGESITYRSADGKVIVDLSITEDNALDWLAQGKSYDQIGAEMGLRGSQIKAHLQNAYAKLRVKGDGQKRQNTKALAIKRRSELTRVLPEENITKEGE